MTLSTFAVTALALWFPTLVVAQSQSFSWGFTTIGSSTSLQECNSYKVGVALQQIGSNPVGVPPFYMLAYPPNGIPSVALLGSDPNSLSWTVDYPSGTSLLLEVADSNGNSGGVEQAIYKVTPGSSSSCHGNPSSSITVTTTSTSVTTCDPLVLNISGGTRPYTVSIAAQNGLHVYNTTLGPNDNQFTWIDRAIPSDSNVLLATVHDATGQYAPSTSFISVSGSDDVTCTGKNDAGGQQQSSPSSGGGNNNTPPPSSSGGSSPPPNNSQAPQQPSGGTVQSVTVVAGGSTMVVPATSVPPGAQTLSSNPNSPSGPSSGSPSAPTGSTGGNNNNNNGSPSNPQSNTGTSNQSSNNTPVIVGSVLGALALIAILALAVIINNKRKNRNRPDWDGFTEKPEPQYPLPPAPVPFNTYANGGNPNGGHVGGQYQQQQNGYIGGQQQQQQNGYVGGQQHQQLQYEQFNSPFSDYNHPAQQQLPQAGGSLPFNTYGPGQTIPLGAAYGTSSSLSMNQPPLGAAGAIGMGERRSTALSQSSSSGVGGLPPPTSPSSDWDSRTHTSTSFSDRQQPSQKGGAVTMNPTPTPTSNPNSSSRSERDVIQHEDGGPVREENHEDNAPTEVPPAYENIRRD